MGKVIKHCEKETIRSGYESNIFLGMNPLPQHSQPMVTPGMVNVGMANTGRAMMANNQLPMQQLPAPPGYNMAGANRPPRWPMMPPQVQRQPYIPQKQVNTTQGSALIAQLTQPPSSVAASGVNQFGQSKCCLMMFS